MPRQAIHLRQIADWEYQLRQEKKSKYTIRSYTAAARKAVTLLQERDIRPTPSRLTEQQIKDIMPLLKTMEYKSGFKSFLTYCQNPHIRRISLGPKSKPQGYADWLDIDADQDLAVWDAARNGSLQERLLVHLELHLGLRRSSAQRLIMPYYLGRHLIVLGKGVQGGKFRTIPTHPLTADIMKELRDYRTDADITAEQVMAYRSRGSVVVPSDTTLDRMIKNVSKSAGIPFSHHTLRRTCGRAIFMEQMDAGRVNLPAIQMFLGHESLEMTIHYLGIQMFDMEDMMKVSSGRVVNHLAAQKCTLVETLVR